MTPGFPFVMDGLTILPSSLLSITKCVENVTYSSNYLDTSISDILRSISKKELIRKHCDKI